MQKTKVLSVLISCVSLAGVAGGQVEEPHPNECHYSVLHNGPTWDSNKMSIPYDVVANAWARDGAYGGTAVSNGMGLAAGGAGVAVASVSYWFKVTHHPVPSCVPVRFDSEATLEAEVATSIDGDGEDYALATGFQSISGVALAAATLAVAATNAGSPVQQSTVQVTFGSVSFALTVPGVSVTADDVDKDRNKIYTWGSKKIKEEKITIHCWTKVKAVTNGPFGGRASASINYTRASASTESECTVHQKTGGFVHDVSEG